MNYELMIVARTSGSEGLLSRVEKALKDANSTDLKIDKLGKKTLAYPIKKQTEADYFVLNFNCEPTQVKQLSDMLRLEQDDLLRHLFLKLVDKKKVRKSKRSLVVESKPEPKGKAEKKEKPKVTVVTKKVSNVSKVTKVTKGKRTSKK